MGFLAVLKAKQVCWSDPLLAISCTSSRISAFFLALHHGSEGKSSFTSFVSGRWVCPGQHILNHCPASGLGKCPPRLGNLSCFSCWNRRVCMDLPSFESLSLGQAKSCSLTHGGMAEMETLLPDLGSTSCSEKTLPGFLGWAAHLNAPVTLFL